MSAGLPLECRKYVVEQRRSSNHPSTMCLYLANKIGQDIGMERGDILAFPGIFEQVEQQRRVVLSPRLTLAVCPRSS